MSRLAIYLDRNFNPSGVAHYPDHVYLWIKKWLKWLNGGPLFAPWEVAHYDGGLHVGRGTVRWGRERVPDGVPAVSDAEERRGRWALAAQEGKRPLASSTVPPIQTIHHYLVTALLAQATRTSSIQISTPGR